MKILFSILVLFSTSALAKNTNVSTGGPGRFQLIQLSDMRRDQHLIDTQTGKIWSSVCVVTEAGNCEMDAWTPDYVVGITISEVELYKKRAELKKFIEDQKKTPTAPTQ